MPQRRKALETAADRQNGVAAERPCYAREASRSVTDQELRLAERAGKQQNLSGAGSVSLMLGWKCQSGGPDAGQRRPDRLAAPTCVDDLAVKRHQLAQGPARERSCVSTQERIEYVIADAQVYVCRHRS